MIPLISSIIASSLLFVIFKLFKQFNIDTFQAIVFNYFTAFLCGILLFGKEWNNAALHEGNWKVFVVIAAVLFISLFLLMGLSSQRNGVASTSIAVKMSMAISVLAMILYYNEALSVLKITGIALAFAGVLLVTFAKQDKQQTPSVWMLVVLFFGSGCLDFVLNYVQKYELHHLTPSLFSAFGFGVAGCIGLVVLMIQFYRKQSTFALRNVAAGILLGIPNYFSIYLLIVSYKSTGWSDSTVLTVMNVAVVLLAAILGFVAFKEALTPRKIIGLFVAISAIFIMYLANSI